MTLTLSKAEMNVGCLLALGFSKKEIALKRNTSVSTIRHQTESIYLKTNCKNLADITRYMIAKCAKIDVRTLLSVSYLKTLLFCLSPWVVSDNYAFYQFSTLTKHKINPLR